MDDFEKHIIDQKAAFDEHTADRAKLWSHISMELERSNVKRLSKWKRPWVRIAAAVTLLAGITVVAALLVFGNATNPQNSMAVQELQEIEMHYTSLVTHQIALVQNHPQLTEADKKEFLSFIEELDREYEILKSEMTKNLNNERVLEAIVENYKKRIELIERLLQQINHAKSSDDSDGFTL